MFQLYKHNQEYMKENSHIELASSEDAEVQGLEPGQEDSQREKKTQKILFAFMITIMLIATSFNAYASFFESQQVQIDQKTLQNERLEASLYSTNVVKRMQAEHNLSKYSVPISSKVKERIAYGQPRPRNYFIKAVIISEKNAKPNAIKTCVLTNGVSIISNKTIKTARSFLSQPEIDRWIVLLPSIDKTGNDLLANMMNDTGGLYVQERHELEIDSDYRFITEHTKSCDSFIYLQNNFVIDEANAKNFVNASITLKTDLKFGYVGYSAYMKTPENTTKQLKSLEDIDLYTVKQEQFSEYVFVFDAKFLNVITPLNFVHYAKYTIQQMIIYPILAITQNTKFLTSIKTTTHIFDVAVVQFKEFELRRPAKKVKQTGKSFCFVSSPLTPEGISYSDFHSYVKSIQKMKSQNISSLYIVSNFAYNFKGDGLFETFRVFSELLDHNSNITARMRIKQGQAVSSLGVYESAHTYCPDSSLIVSSRINAIFDSNFLNEVSNVISEKYHYYYAGNISWNRIEEIFARNTDRKHINKKSLLGFMKVQIFKSDFMRMIHLWALKQDECAFYQTQASFVIPMIQMSGFSVQQIPNAHYEVYNQRGPTSQESEEIDLINKYSRWDEINDNILKPILYNSLTNLDLRRGALDLIPKNIHQIWLKNQPLPKSVGKLQKTIKKINKDYNYTLWDRKMLNPYDFPFSYGLLARIFEHEYSSGKSYHPWAQAIMSYEILYNHGGVYLSLKAEARKSMDPFLKYELFFAGFYNTVGNYGSPLSVGREVMGARKRSYHLRLVLAELITVQSMNLELTDYEALVGGDVLRISLTNNELFTATSFGFNLFTYDPYRTQEDPCDNTIPCRLHSEAYIVLHNLI